MTRAIVFDLDGTLIDSMPEIAHAVNAVLGNHGIAALDLATVTGFVGDGLPKLMERVIEHVSLDPADHARLSAAVLDLYMGSDGSLTTLYPNVISALNTLQQDGYVMAICTNKPHDAALHNLTLHGLVPYFDVVIGGDSLDVRKPDPAPLQTCIERLNSTHTLYVGDSEVDAETAQRVGVPFALFTEGYRKSPIGEIAHTHAFSDFADLREIAAAIARGQ